MSFSQDFSVSQSPVNPAYLIITDTSSGTDGLITARRIYIQDSDGNFIVPSGTTTSYITWTYPSPNPISLDILTQDVAANVKVEWLYAGNVMHYELDNNYCFSEFNKRFLYYLIQLQSLTYNIIQDTNYWGNVGIFWTNIIGAIKSVEIGNDIFASQQCLNRATFMQTNQDKYF
jgi:hypothetical protein